MQKDNQEQGTVVRGQMEDRRFGDEDEARVLHWQRGPDCTVEVYVSEESEEGATVLWQGEAVPRVRAAKSSEIG